MSFHSRSSGEVATKPKDGLKSFLPKSLTEKKLNKKDGEAFITAHSAALKECREQRPSMLPYTFLNMYKNLYELLKEKAPAIATEDGKLISHITDPVLYMEHIQEACFNILNNTKALRAQAGTFHSTMTLCVEAHRKQTRSPGSPIEKTFTVEDAKSAQQALIEEREAEIKEKFDFLQKRFLENVEDDITQQLPAAFFQLLQSTLISGAFGSMASSEDAENAVSAFLRDKLSGKFTEILGNKQQPHRTIDVLIQEFNKQPARERTLFLKMATNALLDHLRTQFNPNLDKNLNGEILERCIQPLEQRLLALVENFKTSSKDSESKQEFHNLSDIERRKKDNSEFAEALRKDTEISDPAVENAARILSEIEEKRILTEAAAKEEEQQRLLNNNLSKISKKLAGGKEISPEEALQASPASVEPIVEEAVENKSADAAAEAKEEAWGNVHHATVNLVQAFFKVENLSTPEKREALQASFREFCKTIGIDENSTPEQAAQRVEFLSQGEFLNLRSIELGMRDGHKEVKAFLRENLARILKGEEEPLAITAEPALSVSASKPSFGSRAKQFFVSIGKFFAYLGRLFVDLLFGSYPNEPLEMDNVVSAVPLPPSRNHSVSISSTSHLENNANPDLELGGNQNPDGKTEFNTNINPVLPVPESKSSPPTPAERLAAVLSADLHAEMTKTRGENQAQTQPQQRPVPEGNDDLSEVCTIR